MKSLEQHIAQLEANNAERKAILDSIKSDIEFLGNKNKTTFGEKLCLWGAGLFAVLGVVVGLVVVLL